MAEVYAGKQAGLQAKEVVLRCKMSRDPLLLSGADGRQVWPRRRRDILKLLERELGRQPSVRESLLLSNAASVATRAEMLTAGMLAGKGGAEDDVLLIRFTNSLSRLLASLGLPTKGSSQSAVPSLAEYLRQRQQPKDNPA